MVATLRKCLAFLSPQERRRWAWLVPFAITGALLESMGAAAVFGLIKVVSAPNQIRSLPVLSLIYPLLPWQGERQLVFFFTILVALFYIVKNILLVGVSYAQYR